MLLQVQELRSDFVPLRAPAVHAVRGVSFSIERSEMLGIVGESGSGKSVTAMSLAGLLDRPGRVVGGSAVFDGADLIGLPESAMRAIRGKRIAYIFQDPMTALNPVLTIGTQIVETIRTHSRIGVREAKASALYWLKAVHIPDPDRRIRQYPYELSGGMRQRVMIAMAFALQPELLIADEPTTALDVTIQAQILDLMDEMRRASGAAVLLITHDLGIVAERCDRVAVMYAGEIVEMARAENLFKDAKHPYTQALLAALPDVERPAGEGPLIFLMGQPPRLTADNVPAGCAFAPRCAHALEICSRETPPRVLDAANSEVQCWLYRKAREDGVCPATIRVLAS
jgi:oligopeptide/dipeptide ABC transporter ATP-binding protein